MQFASFRLAAPVEMYGSQLHFFVSQGTCGRQQIYHVESVYDQSIYPSVSSAFEMFYRVFSMNYSKALEFRKTGESTEPSATSEVRGDSLQLNYCCIKTRLINCYQSTI